MADREMEIAIVQILADHLPPGHDGSWLSGMDPDSAFIRAVSAGPWKFNRRQHIFEEALSKMNVSGLLYSKPESIFPLAWQNKFYIAMVESLQLENKPFLLYVDKWKKSDWQQATNDFFSMCNCPKGCKVLWLFVRDYLDLPAFPIDRHVKRWLDYYDLPVNTIKMIDLCKEADVNINDFARALFSNRIA
jgi:hypothetical protein